MSICPHGRRGCCPISSFDLSALLGPTGVGPSVTSARRQCAAKSGNVSPVSAGRVTVVMSLLAVAALVVLGEADGFSETNYGGVGTFQGDAVKPGPIYPPTLQGNAANPGLGNPPAFQSNAVKSRLVYIPGKPGVIVDQTAIINGGAELACDCRQADETALPPYVATVARFCMTVYPTSDQCNIEYLQKVAVDVGRVCESITALGLHRLSEAQDDLCLTCLQPTIDSLVYQLKGAIPESCLLLGKCGDTTRRRIKLQRKKKKKSPKRKKIQNSLGIDQSFDPLTSNFNPFGDLAEGFLP